MHIPNSRKSAQAFHGLGPTPACVTDATGGRAPHLARLVALAAGAASFALGTAAASAAPRVMPPPSGQEHFIAVAALGGAVRVEGAWDGGFGGEAAIGSVGRGTAGGGWAVSGGALGYSRRSGGRAWLEVNGATRWPTGWLVGIGAGPALDFHEFRDPRWGAQATVWILAGVVPYLRAGAFEGGTRFAEAGVRIAFPALRW